MASPNRHHSQPNQKRSGVFISYARSDGETFAHRLSHQLEQQKIKVWMDRIGMEGGHDWWLQITKAINDASFLLLVVTPDALQSNIVRDEWRYARQQGVCVYPIKGSADIDYGSMPRWMRDAAFYDLGSLEDGDLSPEWPKFLNDLQKTPDVRRVPFMVEDLPANFVHRSREFDQLIALLLDRSREEPVAITAALRGAGGYGKTTIAKSLCHNEGVQDAFDDGILWVTLGETPGDLTGRVEDLIQTLSGERPGFTGLEAAITRFTELLADRDILLVIDDVWNRDHLRPFLQGGRRCARLITTRNLDTLPPHAQQVKVDAMQHAEAVKMLCTGLPDGEVASCNGELTALAVRLGEWPLLLGLAGAALQDSVQNTNQSLPEAINYVNRALEKRGLTFFDARDTESRNQAVAKTIGVSLDLLQPAERARYDELAVFPEDVNIPLPTLGKFWASTGAANSFDAEFDTEELCTRLNRLSLLHTFDAKARYIRLHDVIRQYLMHEQHHRLTSLHIQLLDAHLPFPDRPFSPALYPPSWSAMADNEPYFWDFLAFHLIEAARGVELVATVKDWRYLAKKTLLRKSHAVESDLVKAKTYAPADTSLWALLRSFANTGHLFDHCQTRAEVEATMYYRLQHQPELKQMLLGLAQSLDRPHIAAQFELPDLPHPALIRTLEGHSSFVKGCAFSQDGKRIASASSDNTLKVWDAETSDLIRTLEGHSNTVNGCALSQDGKHIVSASDDHTLIVWNAETGNLIRTLKGHSNTVENSAFSQDGKRIISASSDNTLKIWDVETGDLIRTLEGHSFSANGCAFSQDGKRIVSASSDRTLKIWDTETGDLIRTLEGHSSFVIGCAFSQDGKRIVSASFDLTLKIWNAETGDLIHTLKGHSSYVRSCSFSQDGKRIASASDDHTLIVWDAKSGERLGTLEGHSSSVSCCAFSQDGKRIASASSDNTLKVWDAETSDLIRTLEGHSNTVNGCALSQDGKHIVSASDDHTLIVWNAETGNLIRTLKGHSSSVIGCAFSQDGKRIVSASSDDTLKIWDVETGDLIRTLEGHSFSVIGCAFSQDGKRIVSASYDCRLKVWDAETGDLIRTLEGHSSFVIGCAFSQDGKRIVSASYDYRLKVWDTETGDLIHTLRGHTDFVNDCAFSQDLKHIVSASSDSTLKVWYAYTGNLLRTFEGHSDEVNGCIFSQDGKHVVSASSDNTLKVWDTETSECLATFYADGPLNACAIHGEIIVAGGVRGVYFLRLVQ